MTLERELAAALKPAMNFYAIKYPELYQKSLKLLAQAEHKFFEADKERQFWAEKRIIERREQTMKNDIIRKGYDANKVDI